MKSKKYLYLALVTSTLVLFLSTNPQKMPLLVLIFPFVAIFLLAWALMSSLLRYFNGSLPTTKRRSRAAIIAAFPLSCLLLQSVGQFSLRDFVTITLLFAVAWFYLNRTSLA